MEVILLERIEKLGQMGDIVKVKPGYARNFLLPQKKAMRASDDNKKVFEERKAQLEADNLKRREEAQAVSEKMEGLSIVLVRQAGEAGQLYGSVNARDIADTVTKEGFTVSRGQVVLPKPIKAIGLHEVAVRLHPEVAVDVTVNVARSEEEAEVQAKTGKALIGMDDEDEEEAPAPEDLMEVAPEGLEGEEGSDEEAPAEAEDAEAPAEEAPAEEEASEEV